MGDEAFDQVDVDAQVLEAALVFGVEDGGGRRGQRGQRRQHQNEQAARSHHEAFADRMAGLPVPVASFKTDSGRRCGRPTKTPTKNWVVDSHTIFPG